MNSSKYHERWRSPRCLSITAPYPRRSAPRRPKTIQLSALVITSAWYAVTSESASAARRVIGCFFRVSQNTLAIKRMLQTSSAAPIGGSSTNKIPVAAVSLTMPGKSWNKIVSSTASYPRMNRPVWETKAPLNRFVKNP